MDIKRNSRIFYILLLVLSPVSFLCAETRQELLNQINRRIIPNGASSEAIMELKRVVHGMLKNVPPDVVSSMVKKKVYIEIVPRNKRLTDLPDFALLKGQKTIDGRLWENVKGVADVALKNGGVAVAIPEENLINGAMDSRGYSKNFTAIHEFSHMLKLFGISDAYRYDLENIYRSIKNSGRGSGLGSYADLTSDELFAMASPSYFGVGYSEGITTASELEKVNKPIHTMMEKVYSYYTLLKCPDAVDWLDGVRLQRFRLYDENGVMYGEIFTAFNSNAYPAYAEIWLAEGNNVKNGLYKGKAFMGPYQSADLGWVTAATTEAWSFQPSWNVSLK